MTDTLLMKSGMQTLIDNLGCVEAEKFIWLIMKEPMDYTQWRQKNLFNGMSIESISSEAMNLHNS
ncbi:MAG: hypothetical protein LBB36_02430 [Fibromonadaceae bacterium]|jgi:hypothetical protein|nr:hypothetical protein [Fibromonadaceae bacterium]